MEGTGSEGLEDDAMIPEFRDRAFSSWENMGKEHVGRKVMS